MALPRASAQTLSPKPRAAASATPGNGTAIPANPNPASMSAEQKQRYEATVSELKGRIGRATAGVMERITSAENDLYIRFSYFKKPDRLNPNSFGSKDDIVSWQSSLQELKNKEDNLEKLYSAASDNLVNALTDQKINYPLADQIRKELVKSFPWDTIQKRQLLMQQFIDAHGQLLTLYDKNWKLWSASPAPGQPVFPDPKLNRSFVKLSEEISSTGQQIDGLYAKMKQ